MSASLKTCAVCGRSFDGGEEFCPKDGTPLSVPGALPRSSGGDPLIGVTLDGRYRILGVIGEGGMGIVYEAEHVLIEKRVAVKVLRADFTRKPDVVARFRQEARSASRIGHPNIIDVMDFGQTPSGASYFVMEKLQGEDLAEVLSRECVLAPARAVFLIHQCCRALSAAHNKGIFHRDLKPENLFIVRGEHGAESIKVVDFGVAKMTDLTEASPTGRKLTRTGMLFGTPEYMSPEQSKGHVLDHRADIYALGVILYELVTGRVPFEGENFMEVLHKHGNDPVPAISAVNPGTQISEPLRLVIFRALEKDRGIRFQTMDEMASALSRVPEMPSPERPEGPPPWSLTPAPSRPVPSTKGGAGGEPGGASAGVQRSLTTLDLGRSRRVRVGLAAGAVAAVIGVAITFVPDSSDHADVVASQPVLIQAAPATDPARAELPAAPATAVPAQERATQLLSVRLSSQPIGAQVEAEGGVLCESTPCSVDLEQGMPVVLRFSHRGLHSQARVTPDRDGQTVFVNLERRGGAKAAKSRSTTAPAATDHGLKIPEAFR